MVGWMDGWMDDGQKPFSTGIMIDIQNMDLSLQQTDKLENKIKDFKFLYLKI